MDEYPFLEGLTFGDYTAVQTSGDVVLPSPKSEDFLKQISMFCQEEYRRVYGERPVQIHVLATSVLGRAWFVSQDFFTGYVLRFPTNLTVFTRYDNGHVEFCGWLPMTDIRKRVTKSLNGDAFDIYPPFNPMSTYAAAFRREVGHALPKMR